jgi:hypothetical protein
LESQEKEWAIAIFTTFANKFKLPIKGGDDALRLRETTLRFSEAIRGHRDNNTAGMKGYTVTLKES